MIGAVLKTTKYGAVRAITNSSRTRPGHRDLRLRTADH
jgi:hypothetical protein